MNFKDLYLLWRQWKMKDGKDVKLDTPIAYIEGIDFDNFRNKVQFDLEIDIPSSETDNEW